MDSLQQLGGRERNKDETASKWWRKKGRKEEKIKRKSKQKWTEKLSSGQCVCVCVCVVPALAQSSGRLHRHWGGHTGHTLNSAQRITGGNGRQFGTASAPPPAAQTAQQKRNQNERWALERGRREPRRKGACLRWLPPMRCWWWWWWWWRRWRCWRWALLGSALIMATVPCTVASNGQQWKSKKKMRARVSQKERRERREGKEKKWKRDWPLSSRRNGVILGNRRPASDEETSANRTMLMLLF